MHEIEGQVENVIFRPEFCTQINSSQMWPLHTLLTPREQDVCEALKTKHKRSQNNELINKEKEEMRQTMKIQESVCLSTFKKKIKKEKLKGSKII